MTFDGGAGADTARFNAWSGAVTQDDLSGKFTNIEAIDAREAGVAGAFSMTSALIQSLTGKTGAAATLELILDQDDTFDAAGSTYVDGAYTWTDPNQNVVARLVVTQG